MKPIIPVGLAVTVISLSLGSPFAGEAPPGYSDQPLDVRDEIPTIIGAACNHFPICMFDVSCESKQVWDGNRLFFSRSEIVCDLVQTSIILPDEKKIDEQIRQANARLQTREGKEHLRKSARAWREKEREASLKRLEELLAAMPNSIGDSTTNKANMKIWEGIGEQPSAEDVADAYLQSMELRKKTCKIMVSRSENVEFKLEGEKTWIHREGPVGMCHKTIVETLQGTTEDDFTWWEFTAHVISPPGKGKLCAKEGVKTLRALRHKPLFDLSTKCRYFESWP